jgi:hypothetical protein
VATVVTVRSSGTQVSLAAGPGQLAVRGTFP